MPETKGFFDQPAVRLQILQVYGGAVLALVDQTVAITLGEAREAEAMRMLKLAADFADAKERDGDLSGAAAIREDLRKTHIEIGAMRKKFKIHPSSR